MLEYSKCRENMYMIMLLPDSKHDLKDLEETIKYLEDIGSVPYIKTISCTSKQLENLLFWWHNNLNFQSRINETKNILNNILQQYIFYFMYLFIYFLLLIFYVI